jgi:ribonuclease HI
MDITFTWIPGHMDIEGNEQAEKAAKEAANSREMEPNTYYPSLKSARSKRRMR